MNNIESTFRAKSKGLQQKPSAGAWNKLEARLSAAPQKRFQLRPWVIAAGFIGLILLATLFFNINKSSSSSFINETVSLDFSDLDYSDAASKINVLHQAYVNLDLK